MMVGIAANEKLDDACQATRVIYCNCVCCASLGAAEVVIIKRTLRTHDLVGNKFELLIMH